MPWKGYTVSLSQKTEHRLCFEGLGSCNLMVSVKNDNAGDYTTIKVCVGSINNHLSCLLILQKRKLRKEQSNATPVVTLKIHGCASS